jgi:hypothetical protein
MCSELLDYLLDMFVEFMGIESKIENGYLLTGIFGRWPSFHDAEVLHIELNRGETRKFNPYLQAAIHVYEVTSQVEGRRRIMKNHVAVTFRFIEICKLRLEEFNHQNVLQDLCISDVSDRQLERIKFDVSFDGIFGVSAKFECHLISIESVEPYLYERR